MSNYSPPDYRKPQATRAQEKASAYAKVEVDKYQAACEWYLEHLNTTIYRGSPVLETISIDPDGEKTYNHEKYKWLREWQDAQWTCIRLNIQQEFYDDFEKITGRKDLVDAFKKREVILKLRAILRSAESDDIEKVEKFHEVLGKHKSTLVARRRAGNALDTFVRMLGVVCAAILGLPIFGVGAYFTAKEAHARFFKSKGTTGSEFVSKVGWTNALYQYCHPDWD